MSNISLLDCTLRDGGYINQWHFGRQVISNVCEKLAAARLDIIEVGFLTNLPHTEDDSLYANCDKIDMVTFKCCKATSQIAAMIAIGEMELDPVVLPSAANCRLDMVRITFHNSDVEIEKAFRYARCLIEKGYRVCMQPVGTTSYTDEELGGLIAKINALNPYAFYLVDTLGILYRSELLHFIGLIDVQLAPQIRIGFHSHNNLQMSFSNAQCICEYPSDREFIVDCSVYGMGRGAGNLCTELIAQYQNQTGKGHYEMMPIYEILDNNIYPIFLSMDWGYNAHYYVAATHQCHPNYASFLMNKQTLTMNEVDLLLKNIPVENRYIYSERLIEELYYHFQNHAIDDEEALASLKKELHGREVLLLASGKSLRTCEEQIRQFILKNEPAVISVNSLYEGYDSDYLFVSNLKRLHTLDTSDLNIPLILTSNLPNIVKNGFYVDYSMLCDQSHEEIDNSGMMLIRLMKRIGIFRVYIAGYDGFAKESQSNYFDTRMVNSVAPDSAERKTASIARQLHRLTKEMEIVPLTPSKYFKASI